MVPKIAIVSSKDIATVTVAPFDKASAALL